MDKPWNLETKGLGLHEEDLFDAMALFAVFHFRLYDLVMASGDFSELITVRLHGVSSVLQFSSEEYYGSVNQLILEESEDGRTIATVEFMYPGGNDPKDHQWELVVDRVEICRAPLEKPFNFSQPDVMDVADVVRDGYLEFVRRENQIAV